MSKYWRQSSFSFFLRYKSLIFEKEPVKKLDSIVSAQSPNFGKIYTAQHKTLKKHKHF